MPRLYLCARAWTTVALVTVGAVLAKAQTPAAKPGPIDSALIERTIVEAKWKYVYTLHVGSNTIIHEAGDAYDFYLYFRWDYTAEEFLNGRYERKAWAIAGDRIFYPFRNVNLFRVTQAGRENLALEFTQPNSKGNYQYHFVRVEDDDAPFIKPVNQLPTVTVEGYSPEERRRRRLSGDELAGVKKNRRWWPFGVNADKRLARQERRDERAAERDTRRAERLEARGKTVVEASDMMIEMTGGGFFGGIDPVMRDHTVIKPGGHMVKEFKSVHTDLRRTVADIDVEEYNRLAAFIERSGFFQLERSYDCSTEACTHRKRTKPTPVPLRIAVSQGNRVKVVNVAIWGEDERRTRYVDYPQELEEVIQAVLKVSNGAEHAFARR